MTTDEQLINFIEEAFADRIKPSGRLIDERVDLSRHFEAQDVDEFIRCKPIDIDRSNSALAAFHYVSVHVALWILPFYIISLIRNFSDEDFLVDKISYVLNSGFPGPDELDMFGLGRRMKESASPIEREAVCCFAKWLSTNSWQPGGEGTIDNIIKAWSA